MKGRIEAMSGTGKFPTISILLETSPETLEKYLEKDVEVSIKPYRKKRSLDANSLLWACIGDIAAAIGADTWSVYLFMLERYGVFTHVMVRQDALQALRRQWREIKIVGETEHEGRTLVEVLCFHGSSTYDSKEFARLIDGVISDMKSMGLETPIDSEIKAILEARCDQTGGFKEARQGVPE